MLVTSGTKSSLIRGLNMQPPIFERRRNVLHNGRDRAGSIFRLHMGGMALATWFLAMSESRSMIAMAASGRAGHYLIWALFLVGIAAVADAVINDFMPERFHWKMAKKQRHFILSTMAFCYVAQLYVAYTSMDSVGLMLYYSWNATTIMFISFVDAHQRSKDATCVITCT